MFEKVLGVENKDSQMPVFKSDIMDNESIVEPVSGIGGTSSIEPVSMSHSSVDSIAIWRHMSEKYRDRRLHNQAIQKKYVGPYSKESQNFNKNFQSEYEHDTSNFSSQSENVPWHDFMMKKIWQAQIPIDKNSIEIPEYEKYDHPDDGIPRISDVMSRNVISVIDSTTVEQVVNIFNKHKIHSVPVVNYQNKYLMGVITTTDILSHVFDQKSISTFYTEGANFKQDTLAILDKPVRDFMQTNVIEVPVDCTIKDACKIMQEKNIHRLIVTKDNRVKGVFSSLDAVNILAEI